MDLRPPSTNPIRFSVGVFPKPTLALKAQDFLEFLMPLHRTDTPFPQNPPNSIYIKAEKCLEKHGRLNTGPYNKPVLLLHCHSPKF